MAHDFTQPTCPRCGYDLRGTVATWEDGGACPLDGTCTECGLTFCWVDMFDPTREEPQWCVEYAPGRPWPMAKAMVGTFARSWLPWVFWRRLRLHHEVRLRRIIVYILAMLIVPAVLIYLAAQTTVAVIVRHHAQVMASTTNIPGLIAATEAQIAQWETYKVFETVPVDERYTVLTEARYPLVHDDLDDDGNIDPATIDPDEWRSHWRERMEHLQEDREILRTAQVDPPEVQISYARAIVEAVFTPLRSESSGRIKSPWPYFQLSVDDASAYPAPRDLYHHLASIRRNWNWRFGSGWGALMELAGPALSATPVWVLIALAYPVTFLLLPVTRRKAKVAWIHFARVTAYSVAIPIAVLHASAVVIAAFLFWPGFALTLALLAIVLPILGPIPLLLLWWYCAIRWHLRLPHAVWVTILLAVLTVLVVTPVIAAAIALLSYLFEYPL